MRRSAVPLLCAALTVALAACGDDTDGTATPSPSPVTTPGPVGVRVVTGIDAHQPSPGIDVIFGDVNGTVLHRTRTDAAGQASFTMDEGGMATLVFRNPDNPKVPYLETFTDLRPGDMVESSVVYYSPASVPLLGAIQIDFPERRLPSGTVVIQIDLGCQSWYVYTRWERLQGYVAQVSKYCSLPGDGKLDVVLTALNGDMVPLAFSISRGNALDPSTKTRAYFPDGWRTDFRTLGIAYSNVSAGMTVLSSDVMPSYQGLSRSQYRGPDIAVVPGQSGVRGLRYPDLADALSFAAQLVTAKDAWSGPYLTYFGSFTDTPASVSVDFATDVPPLVSNVALTDGATVRPGVTWMAPADLSKVDIGSYQISWKVVDYYFASWEVLFPPDAQSPLRVPALPDELAAFRPPADPQRLSLDGVVLVTDSSVSGYHDYLAAPITSSGTGSWGYSHTPPRTWTNRTLGGQSMAGEAGRTPHGQGAGARDGFALRRSWLRRAERSRTR